MSQYKWDLRIECSEQIHFFNIVDFLFLFLDIYFTVKYLKKKNLQEHKHERHNSTGVLGCRVSSYTVSPRKNKNKKRLLIYNIEIERHHIYLTSQLVNSALTVMY